MISLESRFWLDMFEGVHPEVLNQNFHMLFIAVVAAFLADAFRTASASCLVTAAIAVSAFVLFASATFIIASFC
jgi:hypothetical protein